MKNPGQGQREGNWTWLDLWNLLTIKGVSKSIAYVIKHANFQLYTVLWRSYLENLTTNEFDFLCIKRCVEKKKISTSYNKAAK